MRVVVTFSGTRYNDTTQRIVEDAPKFGADAVWVYDDWWLEHCRPGYWSKTESFRKHPGCRGVDWFLFKPFTILNAFQRLAPGDTLLFLDADTVPIAPLMPLFDRCHADGGVMLFRAVGCVERAWTKRDALLLMNADTPENHDGQHAVARFMLFEKGGAFPVRQFLMDWFAYIANPFINTFDPSVLGPELPGHVEHRTEQSVLSLLARRYGVRLYREACQFGDHLELDKEIFPTTFHQHGAHTFMPGWSGPGSYFRNVND